MFFLIKTGCQWKHLTNDFPQWRTVYEFYRKWISIGFFDRLSRELNAVARNSQRKSAQPTVAVIDSQSVRTGLAQSAKGIDGGKKQLSRLFSEKLERRIECGVGVCEIEFRHI